MSQAHASQPHASQPHPSQPHSSAAKPKEAVEPPRPRLGRGLAALIGDAGNETDAVVRTRGQRRVPIEFLKPSPFNPRTVFGEEELADLANSIREKGIIQPILVRTKPGVADAYEIIAGERRWRAAASAGLHDVPIITVEADDRTALEIAIIENVQRTNLNALEEAQGYERLTDEFGYSQGDLAKVMGKSRPHVNNTMRLLKLPPPTRDLLATGAISAGHARALLNAEDPVALGEKIVKRCLSVRAVEEIIRREAEIRELGAPVPREPKVKDADTRALERRISDSLGLKVDLRHAGESGEMRLRYASLDQLDRLVALLGG